VTGGRILVSLAGNGGNSALDIGSESGGTAAISGGTLIACGDSSMAEGFGSESTQASILYSLSETAAAGSTMTLLDSEGNTLISEVIPYSFSSAVISCPEMSVGETYTIRIGESEETVEVTDVSVSAGTAAGTGMMPGNMMRGGEGVTPGSFGEGQTPPERPEGEEGFPTPPERPEGVDGFQMQMPQNGAGFGPQANLQNATATDGTLPTPEMTQDSSATAEPAAAGATGSAEAQTAEADSTAAWMLVLVSALVLALGLAVALIYKKSQHIDA